MLIPNHFFPNVFINLQITAVKIPQRRAPKCLFLFPCVSADLRLCCLRMTLNLTALAAVSTGSVSGEGVAEQDKERLDDTASDLLSVCTETRPLNPQTLPPAGWVAVMFYAPDNGRY